MPEHNGASETSPAHVPPLGRGLGGGAVLFGEEQKEEVADRRR